MTDGMPATTTIPPTLVEELIKVLIKGLRAFQMYLPNNPIYQRAIDNVRAAFQPIWAEGIEQLNLEVAETDLVWEEQVIYHQPTKNESFAFGLFKDGMRLLTLMPGVEDEEIIRFLEIVQRARTLPPDAGDDLLTLLWEQDFTRIQYHFTEFFGDLALPGQSGEGAYAEPPPDEAAAASAHQENRAKVAEEAPPRPSSIIELDDFDSTLYWLEENEVRSIAADIEAEYQQDLRSNCLNILFDVFEQRAEEWARSEVLTTLEQYLPHLLNTGEFRSVATVLREIRLLLRRNPDLTGGQREQMDAFNARLSDPAVLQQILQAVTEAQTPPPEEDLGELFKELRPAALETALVWQPKLPAGPIRRLLESAAERLAENSPQEVLRLLRIPESEALVSVIGLCGRLQLQGAVAGLAETLGHQDQRVRVASVTALDAIGTAGAVGHLDRALTDSDREVRITAVQILGRRGTKAALGVIEPIIQGKLPRSMDLTERMRYFEAYALIAGPTSLPILASLLSPGGFFRKKEPADVRACAALALGRLRVPEAREVLEKHKEDKELVVRTAVNRALREGAG